MSNGGGRTIRGRHYDRGFERAVRNGHLTVQEAIERGNRRSYAGYLIERENSGQTIMLTSSPILAVTFQDESPMLGGNLYRVYAVDTSGNASAVATSLVIITGTHTDGAELSN